MRSLLTGYAGAFNRRHRRHGHLFQNRYKPIVLEEESYFLELVRYIHLNPLRGGVLRELRQLDRYPWSGHAALVGREAGPWQETRTVLGRFAPTLRRARERYRAFVAEGVGQGRRPELQGGGLVRSVGRRPRPPPESGALGGRRTRPWEQRVRGRDPAEAVPLVGPKARAAAEAALPTLVDRCAAAWKVAPTDMLSGSRRRVAAHARAVASRLAVRELGLPIAAVARALGISPTVARAGLTRGDDLLKAQGLTVTDLLPATGEKPR